MQTFVQANLDSQKAPTRDQSTKEARVIQATKGSIDVIAHGPQ